MGIKKGDGRSTISREVPRKAAGSKSDPAEELLDFEIKSGRSRWTRTSSREHPKLLKLQGSQMDVFVHVPKTSGSTIRSILSRQYGIEKITYFEPGTSHWRQRNAPGSDFSEATFLAKEVPERGISLITGNYPFGIHRHLKAACRYFTMVRDPTDRCISEYYSAFSNPKHAQREQIISGKLSFDDFLTIARCAQSYVIAGPWYSEWHDRESEPAIENLSLSFVVVGTAERLDKSILLIAKAFGWKPPIFVNKNVTKLDQKNQTHRSQLRLERGRYEDYLKQDYLLYQAADAILSGSKCKAKSRPSN